MQRVGSLFLLLVWLAFIDTRLAVRTCRSDLIYFHTRGEAQLPASINGTRVELSLPDGKVELARDAIRKLVPGFWPASEWDSRRQKVRASGSEERFAAAWWAIENGLTVEVTDEIRAIHARDPKHLPAARMVAVLNRLAAPCIDSEFARFQKALGTETRVARGPHVLLLHQHSEAEANERIAVLERVIIGYHLLFAAQGVALDVPRRRLVSAWFADQKDYLAFLHAENAEAFATTRGYFHPTWNAVVAYDARSSNPQLAARQKLTAKRDELKRYREMVDQAPTRSRIKIKLGDDPLRTLAPSEAIRTLDRIGDEITCESMLLDLDWRWSTWERRLTR